MYPTSPKAIWPRSASSDALHAPGDRTAWPVLFGEEYSTGTIYQLPVVLPPKLGDLVVICMGLKCISLTLKRAMRWRFSNDFWVKSGGMRRRV
jgi:hypothetical protein